MELITLKYESGVSLNIMSCNQTKINTIKNELIDNNDISDYDSQQYCEMVDNSDEQTTIKSEQTDDDSHLYVPILEPKLKKKGLKKRRKPETTKSVLAIEHIEEEYEHNEQIKVLRSTTDDKLVGYRCKWVDCNFANRYLKQVESHIRAKHTNHRPFKCDICANKYADQQRLKTHKREIHSNLCFACEYPDCSFEGKNKRSLTVHKYTHTKPFMCDWPECGQRFAQTSRLNNHRRSVHLKEYRYACDWPGCDKMYTTSQNRNEHMAIHTGKKYACEWPGCDYLSNDGSSLRKHKKHKHMNVPYPNPYRNGVYVKRKREFIEKKCVCTWPECGKKFKDNWNLEKHFHVHSGERPFKCEWKGCEKTFAERGNMIKHLRTHNKLKN